MDQFKHILDGFLGAATLANFFKLLIVGFSLLPTILTIISTCMAIAWYYMQIRAAMRKRGAENDT